MIAPVETDVRHPLWDKVRRHIETRRRPIQDEIRRYPPPIPACDAHFNHLLEQRTLLSRELVRLESACKASGSRAAAADFVRTSPVMAAAEARAILDDRGEEA